MTLEQRLLFQKVKMRFLAECSERNYETSWAAVGDTCEAAVATGVAVACLVIDVSTVVLERDSSP